MLVARVVVCCVLVVDNAHAHAHAQVTSHMHMLDVAHAHARNKHDVHMHAPIQTATNKNTETLTMQMITLHHSLFSCGDHSCITCTSQPCLAQLIASGRGLEHVSARDLLIHLGHPSIHEPLIVHVPMILSKPRSPSLLMAPCFSLLCCLLRPLLLQCVCLLLLQCLLIHCLHW